MIGSRRLVLPALAAVFMIAGFGLMLASLGIESDRTDSGSGLVADVVVPSAVALAATPAASDPNATRLIADAQRADRTLAYGGTKLVSRWTAGAPSSVVVAVDHVPGEGTAVAPGDTGSPVQDAPAQVVTVEGAQRADQVMLGALVRNYRLSTLPDVETGLGREAHIVEATRADGTLAARFWLDTGTGLVLRRDVMDAQGEKLESSSFLRVTFPATQTKATTTDVGEARGWTSHSIDAIDALRTAGWPVPRTMPAGMELYQVRTQAAGSKEVLQLSYTDGLAAMSVFLQHGALDENSLKGYQAVAASGGEVWVRSAGTKFLTWQANTENATPVSTTVATPQALLTPTPSPSVSVATSAAPVLTHDIVVSVTTDSLGAPTGSAVMAFPPVPTDDDQGVSDRVTRGVQRVGSWIDPLG